MSKILVISPSGNLYGSEQVLLDYLKSTKLHFDVMIPVKSKFLEEAKKVVFGHRILNFNDKQLKIFYLQVFFKLLIGKYNTVYINEAGHSKYILLLARIFRSKQFVIHVRIAEDTNISRWKNISDKNIRLISISKTISEKLQFKSTLLYDLYFFSNEYKINTSYRNGEITKIGIIGRVTFTKGLLELEKLVDYITQNNLEGLYTFIMYGDITVDLESKPVIKKLKNNKAIEFRGFVASKKDIYNEIDIVLHLSKMEPLGRIFLEAIDEGKPFIGFNCAGIGEIGQLTGLDELLCNPVNDNFPKEMVIKLEKIRNSYQEYSEKVIAKKKIAAEIFSVSAYTTQMDYILSK